MGIVEYFEVKAKGQSHLHQRLKTRSAGIPKLLFSGDAEVLGEI